MSPKSTRPLPTPLQTLAPAASCFEIERASESSSGDTITDSPLSYTVRPHIKRSVSFPDTASAFQHHLSKLLKSTAEPISVCGNLPFDPASVTLFFHTKSGTPHSLDFPIDVDNDMPYAMSALLSACKRYPVEPGASFLGREALCYPTFLSHTLSLDLSSHPLLEAVRATLFPNLPPGHYLTAERDALEIVPRDARLSPRAPPKWQSRKVATILVTLPSHFLGGSLIVTSGSNHKERFSSHDRKMEDLEWVAFTSGCKYEVETVTAGCRLIASYNVYVQSFGPSGPAPNPLISPSDRFLDHFASVLSSSRGRRIAFMLTGQYDVTPADELAEALVPHLKGGDSLIYHALRRYGLTPELRWSAGGYFWPADRTVKGVSEPTEYDSDSDSGSSMVVVSAGNLRRVKRPVGSLTKRSSRGSDTGTSSYSDEDDGVESAITMHRRVRHSGAVPLADTDILLDVGRISSFQSSVTKARVPFVSESSSLDHLVVNVMMVVYVP